MDLNFRKVSPKIAGLIHQHYAEHCHKNMTEALECIIKQWNEQKQKNQE